LYFKIRFESLNGILLELYLKKEIVLGIRKGYIQHFQESLYKVL
jgi:hypothetical protein